MARQQKDGETIDTPLQMLLPNEKPSLDTSLFHRDEKRTRDSKIRLGAPSLMGVKERRCPRLCHPLGQSVPADLLEAFEQHPVFLGDVVARQ